MHYLPRSAEFNGIFILLLCQDNHSGIHTDLQHKIYPIFPHLYSVGSKIFPDFITTNLTNF